MPRQSLRKRACACGAVELLIRGLCMACLKELLLLSQREQGSVLSTGHPTDKEIHMTDTQPDISEVPADAVAPAPSEAPYTDLTALAEGFDPSASTDEPAVTSVVSADTEPAPATEPASTEKAPRRARTELESRVKTVCDEFVAGGFTLGDGETLTPHRIARRLEDGDAKVSTGAVASVLTRWDGYGFATVNEKPLAFVDYTDAGRTEGLTALKAAHAAKAKADKAAIKAAEASAAT